MEKDLGLKIKSFLKENGVRIVYSNLGESSTAQNPFTNPKVLEQIKEKSSKREDFDD